MSYLVTEDDLARARNDPDFRQQLMALNLERLLEALNRMREAEDATPGVPCSRLLSIRAFPEGLVGLGARVSDMGLTRKGTSCRSTNTSIWRARI